MNESKYNEPIEIIKSITNRYDYKYPDFINKLNKLDTKLSNKNPRHIFCKDDCLHGININKNLYKSNYICTISDCVLSLYNWNKSKIIYHIENPIFYNDAMINKEFLLKFPYTSIYLDMKFSKTKYIGCFVTITREKVGIALQYFLLLNFVSYIEKQDGYSLEPCLLTMKDGISVRDAFKDAKYIYNLTYDEDDPYTKICSYAIYNIYKIIYSFENKEKILISPSSNKEVTEVYAKYSKTKEFNITYESKYQYITNELSHNNGSPKSPHTRRSHKRHLKIKDKNGNIVGEKIITVKESHIHKNEEIIPSVKITK